MRETYEKLRYDRQQGDFAYRTSEEMVKVGDCIYDFSKASVGGKNNIIHCDTEEFVAMVNALYSKTEFIKRPSAKITATNDPRLNARGVPKL